jgi:hypothetical protein
MQVKCTSCGASQNINQAQNCDFCGNLIELESAKSNYQSSLSGEAGNLMAMAETAIEATNWDEALQFFNQVLIKDIANSDAWLGKGIAIVYTSKIGDLKITEAIAYWKNAVKHASNEEAMGKRVAKEINDVVNQFYPTLENHFIQFVNLDHSYQELVSKFATLEAAQDYATQLDVNNISYYETGYLLCKRLIELPKQYANSAHTSAIVGGILGQLTSNEYSRKYAMSEARDKMNQANQLKNEVELASKIVETIINKYISNIKRIDSSHYSVREFEKFLKESEEFIKKEEKNKNLNKYLIIGFIAFAILLIISGAKSELFLLSIIGACIWFVKAIKK